MSLVRLPGAEDDKFSRGVVGLRTGSADYPGAAVLGVEAAWRTGAGFVRYVGEAASAVLARRPETVTGPAEKVRVDVWVIGSGTDAAQRAAEEERELRALLAGRVPVIVDAGALDLAPGAEAPALLTPHERELARLSAELGVPVRAGGDDETRGAWACAVAAAVGHTVLFKGSRTLVATPAGEVLVTAAAPGWLATAGAGDVLAGVLGAVAAANPARPLHEIAATGAWLHGHAAAIAAGTTTGAPGHPIVALDVARALPVAVASLLV